MPTVVVSGLTAGTGYDFRAYAFNTSGSGPVTSPVVTGSTAGIVVPTLSALTSLSATPSANSMQVTFGLPTTGTIDHGGVIIQYKKNADPNWTDGPRILIATTGGGTITDAQGNTWSINTGGQIVVNTTLDTSTSGATMVVLTPDGTAWHMNATDWFFKPSANGPTVGGWTGPATSPFVTGFTIGGLTASTVYNIRGNAYNSAGNGATAGPISGTTTTTITGTGFSISGTPVSMPNTGSLLNVNLTNQTGFVVDKSLFGVASSANNQTYADSFADPGWVAAMATLDIRGWRQQGENMMASMFPSAGSASGANFTGPISIFAAHVRTALPNADLMWTIVDPGMLPDYQTSDVNVLASQVVQLATFLESRGVHISYWDVFNEPEGGPTQATHGGDASGAVFTALAGMNKGYKFGTSPTGPLGTIVAPWPADCIAGYPGIYYIAGHWYGGATDSGSTGRDLSYGSDYDGTNAVGPMASGPSVGSGIAIQNETVNGKKYPLALSEYAFSYGGGGFTNANISNMIASCGYGVMLIEGALSNRIWASHVWDAGQHTYGFASSIGGMAPHIFMLSHGGQKMPGSIVATNLVHSAYSGAGVGAGGGGPYIKVLATTGGLMIVNAGPTGAVSNESIALGGLLNTSLTRWQQVATDSSGGFSNNAGTTTTVSVGGGGLITGQTFPPLSVTMYSA